MFDGPRQGDALGQLVSGQREKPALGRAPDLVSGAPHSLQQNTDGPGRTDLADKIDNTDVDAQFEGRRGDAYLDLPAFQFLFRRQPGSAGETAVVGHYRIVPQARGQLVRDALHHPAGVYEDQGRSVSTDQFSHRLQSLIPHLMGSDGPQLPLGQFDGQVDGPGVAGVYDQTIWLAV